MALSKPNHNLIHSTALNLHKCSLQISLSTGSESWETRMITHSFRADRLTPNVYHLPPLKPRSVVFANVHSTIPVQATIRIIHTPIRTVLHHLNQICTTLTIRVITQTSKKSSNGMTWILSFSNQRLNLVKKSER